MEIIQTFKIQFTKTLMPFETDKNIIVLNKAIFLSAKDTQISKTMEISILILLHTKKILFSI